MGHDMTQPPMRPGGTVVSYEQNPHEMRKRLTATEDLFVLAHMGVPEVAAATWSLAIDGLVRRPLNLTLADLHQRKKRVVESVHNCAGSPMKPTVPTRQVANLRWGGVDLGELLAEAGIDAGATFLWAYGLDHGSFAGAAQDGYLKDIPMARVAAGDVLVAYELNGAPLDVEHGFPARLVVPGYYGTNSVKWLSRLHLADKRAESVFTTRFYNDPIAGTDRTRPVWEIEPDSVLVAPAADSRLPAGDIEIWGWAWSAAPIETVEVSIDGGASWAGAQVELRDGHRWRHFDFGWRARRPGTYTLKCRATDARGATQPLDGARNAVHAVTVTIE